jgi:hypothetical protein
MPLGISYMYIYLEVGIFRLELEELRRYSRDVLDNSGGYLNRNPIFFGHFFSSI